MTHKCDLTLLNKKTDEKIIISGKFDSNEWKLLGAYSQYVTELGEVPILRNGIGSSSELHWDQEKGLSYSMSIPPWDDIIILLHKLRPLILYNEKTYFYNTCNIISKRLPHEWIRNLIKEQRDMFSGKSMKSQVQIFSNGILLNSEKVLKDWLNAYEYHRDEEKKEFLESLHKILPIEASKPLFVSLLIDKTRAILNLSMVVDVVIEKKESIEADI